VWHFYQIGEESYSLGYNFSLKGINNKDMDVNEHERLSNITLRQKLK
jgi:hypothetical protein